MTTDRAHSHAGSLSRVCARSLRVVHGKEPSAPQRTECSWLLRLRGNDTNCCFLAARCRPLEDGPTLYFKPVLKALLPHLYRRSDDRCEEYTSPHS